MKTPNTCLLKETELLLKGNEIWPTRFKLWHKKIAGNLEVNGMECHLRRWVDGEECSFGVSLTNRNVPFRRSGMLVREVS
ncbi:hypothetical protein JTE90_001197 [Oedothorax gibbosus]|uniref:Uncharacterized protein n=1 Tax=Oedothorax gibbosus TaxID=931172 RepID=A0AAV6UVY6_9ARAC|nr:hypothetical protein JTE90_001197 [Oedothorax gibbosus]